ncbi:MAG: GNAT family N-acetyltransferase [Pseudomonadota bacterium]
MSEKISELILTAGPSITEREIAYVLDAVKSGWNWNHSDYIHKFEKTFSDYVGANHAIATSSCTGALHLAMLAAGIGEGDEVIVPELTWIATASAVTYVGATPVFCDVDPDTWSMDANSLEKHITHKTKAIIPVHLYGHPCDMDVVMAIANKHNLTVIEDAAQSIGSEYKGKKTGSFGDLASFSFQGAKALVTGEGGMLLVKDKDVYERARFKGDHGRDPNRTLFNIEIGYKYKMSNMQAALGLAQIERVDEIVDKKIQIFKWYKERLQNIPELQLNDEKSWAKNIFWMSSVVLSDKIKMSRDDFIAKLKDKNIDSRPIFYPISSFPMFESQDNPNAYHVGLRGINLPSGHNRTEEEIHYICSCIHEILGKEANSVPVKNWMQYRENIWKEIKNLKTGEPEDGKIILENDGQKMGYLLPIGEEHKNNDEIIKLLSNWRENSQKYFPSQFKVTEEGTKNWLQKALIEAADRILYLVYDERDKPVGHVGLFRFDYQNQSCELDNIVRGDDSASKGIMTIACNALMQDSFSRYGLDKMYLRVFSDNDRAISLYKNLGFQEIQRVPMTKQEENDQVVWLPYMDSPYKKVDRYFTTMEIGKSDL